MFTWFCQIGATWAGKYIGRRTIILSTWPILLVALAGLCATGYVSCNFVFLHGTEFRYRCLVAFTQTVTLPTTVLELQLSFLSGFT